MLESLRSDLDYYVTWRLVNTCDYGLPQHRPRVYIIGLLRASMRPGVSKFAWPRPTRTCELASLLDRSALRLMPTAPSAKRNLAKLLAEVGRTNTPTALDIFASQPRAVIGKVPCLTRTRAGAGGFYITGVGGLLTTKEMLRLQGLPDHFVDTARAAGISHRQLRQMIGNAMSVNVLVALLRSVMAALDLDQS
jgi:site-specific DNA-cytosine methylase